MACGVGTLCENCGRPADARYYFPAFVIQLCARCSAKVLIDGSLGRAIEIEEIPYAEVS